MDFVATPPHCAFCLCPLPPEESVTCRRCETPYCSAECRSNDLSEGCSKRWTEATKDEETGGGVLKQLQRRMQEQREEQQRSRFRCVVS